MSRSEANQIARDGRPLNVALMDAGDALDLAPRQSGVPELRADLDDFYREAVLFEDFPLDRREQRYAAEGIAGVRDAEPFEAFVRGGCRGGGEKQERGGRAGGDAERHTRPLGRLKIRQRQILRRRRWFY